MKWTPDDHGCIYDETGCFARLTPNKAERLASRHNADIDALTAEIQLFRDAYAHDREIMADNVAYIESYEKRIEVLEAENARLKNNLAVSRQQADKFLAIIDLDPDTQQSRAERAEAERDELQRRLDAVVALIESKVPSEKRPTETQYQYINRQRYNNAQIQMGARIRAIAEGREG